MSFSTQLLFPQGIWIWNITWENYWYEPYLYGLIITVQVPDEARVPLRYIFRITIDQLVMISTASIFFNGSFTFVSCDNMKGFGWLLMLFFYVNAILKCHWVSPRASPSQVLGHIQPVVHRQKYHRIHSGTLRNLLTTLYFACIFFCLHFVGTYHPKVSSSANYISIEEKYF